MGLALTQMGMCSSKRTAPFLYRTLEEAISDGAKPLHSPFLSERMRAVFHATRANDTYIREDTLGVARFPLVRTTSLGEIAGQYLYVPNANVIYLNSDPRFYQRKLVDHGNRISRPCDIVAHTIIHEMLHWFVARFVWPEVPPTPETSDPVHAGMTWGRLARIFLGSASSATFAREVAGVHESIKTIGARMLGGEPSASLAASVANDPTFAIASRIAIVYETMDTGSDLRGEGVPVAARIAEVDDDRREVGDPFAEQPPLSRWSQWERESKKTQQVYLDLHGKDIAEVVKTLTRHGPNALTLLLGVNQCTINGTPYEHHAVKADGEFEFVPLSRAGAGAEDKAITTTDNFTFEVRLDKTSTQQLVKTLEELRGRVQAPKPDETLLHEHPAAHAASADTEDQPAAGGGGGGQ